MRTPLLPGVEKRLLPSAFFCCLWAFAVPTGGKAQAPAPTFGGAVCTVKPINRIGMPPAWQIKGTTSVTDLPADMVRVTLTFQKKAKGAANWSEVFHVAQTTGAVMGTATIDTGFQTLTPAPAQGDQYRILLSGTYTAGVPPMTTDLAAAGSNAITPVP